MNTFGENQASIPGNLLNLAYIPIHHSYSTGSMYTDRVKGDVTADTCTRNDPECGKSKPPVGEAGHIEFTSLLETVWLLQ